MAADGWQTGTIRIELNGPGIRELLLSEGVASDIERRSDAVTRAANARYAEIPVGPRDKGAEKGTTAHIEAKTIMGLGANRARGRVVAEHPAARAVEATHRVLGSSVDAAGI